MAKATKWTAEKVRALRLPAGKSEHRRRVEPNLYLFVRRLADGSLAKQWQYRAQVDGKRRWLSLGGFPGVSLADAAAERQKHEGVLEAAKKGESDHPALVARFARKASKEQPTVKEAFEEWVADKRLGSPRKGGKPVRERTIEILTENYENDIKERIGEARIAAVSSEALRQCIDGARARKAPGAAAQVYRVLRGLFLFALKRGYIDADPMRRVEHPKPYRPQPVNAANDAELRALLRVLGASSADEATKLAIEFQLLTGARPAEVRLSSWSEMDLKRATWTLPEAKVKSGRAFRVHLSPQALEVLRRAREIKRDGKRSPYVFPGGAGEPMEKMAVARALSRLTERVEGIGGKKLRPHDLRRTFRTLLSRLGVLPHVAELCMNHQERETMRRVYDGHDYFGEMADAWDRAGAHIATLRKGGASISSIKEARAA